MTEPKHSGGYIFIAHWLVFLGLWTLVIKFIFPLVFDQAYGFATGTHIMWDFWWVAHFLLAWSLTHWNGITYRLAVIVSVAEIVIIVVKFYAFLGNGAAETEWTIWRTSWFINKVFVLTCFIVLLSLLLRDRGKR